MQQLCNVHSYIVLLLTLGFPKNITNECTLRIYGSTVDSFLMPELPCQRLIEEDRLRLEPLELTLRIIRIPELLKVNVEPHEKRSEI